MPLTASRRWLALAPLLAACQGSPATSVLWRESFELLVATRDGGLVDARVVVGNTGLLRGQAHLRADRWTEGEAPILYGRDVAPVEVQVDPARSAVRLGADGLVRGEHAGAPDTWTFRSRDDEAQVLLQLTPEDGLQVPAVGWQEGGGQWTLSAPVARGRVEGWFSAADRGGLVEGMGVLLHRGGDGVPALPRRALLVTSRDVSLGLDAEGQGALSWAWIEGQRLDPGQATWEVPARGAGVVRFASGLTVELRRQRKLQGRRLPFEHLLPLEQRLLDRLGQWRERRVQRARARVRWQGRTWDTAAVLLEVSAVPWQAPAAALPDDTPPLLDGAPVRGPR